MGTWNSLMTFNQISQGKLSIGHESDLELELELEIYVSACVTFF